MIVLPVLALWSIITACSLVRAGTPGLSLHNFTSPESASHDGNQLTVGVDSDTHCTRDPAWIAPSFPNIGSYDYTCQDALAQAIRDLTSYGLDSLFEFLDRGVPAQTSMAKMFVPRRYVATPPSWQPYRPPCTVAIVMIGSLSPGVPLPGQPRRTFRLSDITTMRELLYSPGHLGKPFLQCLRGSPVHPLEHAPALGWSQAGRRGNIGIFYTGTESLIDQRIPQAVYPISVEET